MSPRNRLLHPVAAALTVACLTGAIRAAPDPAAALEHPAKTATTGAPPPAPVPQPPAWEKPVPLEFGISYTLVSDYVWRGINFSEYPGEGTERPNHQMNLALAVATEKLGTFGVNFWFQWYGGQRALSPDDDGHLQEVDYTAWWSYPIAPIGTTVELGWIAYHFPRSGGDARSDYEAYAKLYFDDSVLFGTQSPVLNPYIYYGLNLDLAEGASWIEAGISHDFRLSELAGLARTPLGHLTITPSLVLGVDHRLLHAFAGVERAGPSTKLAFLNYGLTAAYDLSAALNLPPRYGSLSVAVFVNFSQALRDDLLNDEFYGGLTLSYNW